MDTNPFSDNNGGIDIPLGSGGGSGGGGGGNGAPPNDSGHTLPPIVITPVLPEEPEEPEEDCNTSKDDLMELFPNGNEADLQILADVLNDYGADFGIDTEAELQHFLAQTGHETEGFTTLNVTESTNYSTPARLTIYSAFTMDSTAAVNNSNLYYAPEYMHDSAGVANIAMCCKYGNGGVASGDGYKYRGRGIVQLTWHDNYLGFQTWYNNEYEPDIDIMNDPDLIATDKNLSILSGLWYFKERVLDKLSENEMTIFNVSILINNPRAKVSNDINGYNDRNNKYNNATQMINCN